MRCPTHQLKNDRGSVTVEAAVVLSALVIVAAAIFSGMAALGARLSAIDIAGAAARAHAIGIDYTPPVGDVTVDVRDGIVSVTANVGSPFGSMTAHAVYPQEQP